MYNSFYSVFNLPFHSSSQKEGPAINRWFFLLYYKIYFFNLIKIAIDKRIINTPIAIRIIHKILFNSKFAWE